MRRLMVLLLLLSMLLSFSFASALEISDDDFDYWYEEMEYLVDEIGNRTVGSPGEKAALEYLRGKFQEYGYSYDDGSLVDSHKSFRYFNSDLQDFVEIDDAVSLVAIKRAKTAQPKIVTISAHYDCNYSGARDNASGVAALLMLMRMYADAEPFEDTELRFIAFTAEETGHQGSLAYCEQMTDDERLRTIAAFNIDIITVDIWEELCFAIDTFGMRTPGGYVTGRVNYIAYNRVALAMLAAMEELGYYPEEDLNLTWCLPRNMGGSDHESFHMFGMDAANICFHYPVTNKGGWPQYMHTENDTMGDFDYDRTRQALDTLYTAIDHLSNDHSYGD